MKDIWLYIVVFPLLLLGVVTLSGNISLSEEGEEVSYSLAIDDGLTDALPDKATGYILPVSLEYPHANMELAEVQPFSLQLRMLGRVQRSFFAHYSLYSKLIAWKMCLVRMDRLSHSFSRFYAALPRSCWKVSSEHYVFGMRRILI